MNNLALMRQILSPKRTDLAGHTWADFVERRSLGRRGH
jgi:hypothetical protein